MSYRTDDRPHCSGCGAAMAAAEGVFTPSGELVCRVCNGNQLVARTNVELSRAAGSALTPDRPDTRAGYVFLAPVAGFTLWCLLQLADQWMRPTSCSELGCLGLVLVPMAGVVVAVPCAIMAVLGVPAAARRRVAFAVFGAVLLMVASCITAMG